MTWLWIALLGGGIGVDSTAFPQIMVSRPLVAGALAGLLFGRPYEGMLLGALLEVFHIATLPIGAARYPEAGTAAVSGASAYLVVAPTLEAHTLMLAGVFALAWERIAGASVVLLRRTNERLVFDSAVATDPGRMIAGRHLVALLLDFVRGAIVTMVGALAGAALLFALAPMWGLPDYVVRSAVAVATATVLAGALVVFGGWVERKRIFLFGIVCGTLLALVA
jgi:PTS system mannose-specific IIC component